MPKFDVIIGNPPYQSEGGYKGLGALWPKFINLSIDTLEEGGILNLITPFTWFSPGFNDLRNKMTSFNLAQVDLDVKKYFEKIGSGFSSWILIKETKYDKTVFIQNGKEVYGNIRNREFLPNRVNETVFSILDKTIWNKKIPKLKVNISSECHSQDDTKVRFQKDDIFKYPVYHTNTVLTYCKKPHSNFYDKKVIFALTGNFNPIYDPGTMGTGQNVFWINVKDENEGQNIINFFSSKLWTFINARCRWSGANTRGLYYLIPKFDFSQKITDKELYHNEYYNLKEEEIEYLEKNLSYTPGGNDRTRKKA